VEALLLIELLPSIEGDTSSKIPEALKDASTTHIIAISGFKSWIIVGLLKFLC